MCISRAKAVMIGPLVSANFLPVLSKKSCTTSIHSNPIPPKTELFTETEPTMYHIAEWAGDLFF